MRQGGIIAAGGLHALTHHLNDLIEDHRRAERISEVLVGKFGSDAVRNATNMIHLNLPVPTYRKLAGWLTDKGISVGRPRWVFHRDIDAAAERKLSECINEFPR